MHFLQETHRHCVLAPGHKSSKVAMNVALRRSPILFITAASALAGLSGVARADIRYERLMPAPGLQANGNVDSVHISSQGRTVVFSTSAINWGNGESFAGDRVVAVDLDSHVVEIISRNFESTIFRGEDPAVSGDGRYVAFLTLHHPAGPASRIASPVRWIWPAATRPACRRRAAPTTTRSRSPPTAATSPSRPARSTSACRRAATAKSSSRTWTPAG